MLIRLVHPESSVTSVEDMVTWPENAVRRCNASVVGKLVTCALSVHSRRSSQVASPGRVNQHQRCGQSMLTVLRLQHRHHHQPQFECGVG